MPNLYNIETKNILEDWMNALKQNKKLDKAFVVRIEGMIDLAEIGDPEKIHKLIDELEKQV